MDSNAEIQGEIVPLKIQTEEEWNLLPINEKEQRVENFITQFLRTASIHTSAVFADIPQKVIVKIGQTKEFQERLSERKDAEASFFNVWDQEYIRTKMILFLADETVPTRYRIQAGRALLASRPTEDQQAESEVIVENLFNAIGAPNPVRGSQTGSGRIISQTIEDYLKQEKFPVLVPKLELRELVKSKLTEKMIPKERHKAIAEVMTQNGYKDSTTRSYKNQKNTRVWRREFHLKPLEDKLNVG